MQPNLRRVLQRFEVREELLEELRVVRHQFQLVVLALRALVHAVMVDLRGSRLLRRAARAASGRLALRFDLHYELSMPRHGSNCCRRAWALLFAVAARLGSLVLLVEVRFGTQGE